VSNLIKEELEKIDIPKEIHERAKIGAMKAKLENRKRKIKKIAIPLAASGFLILSTGVGAAHIPSINNIVAAISPEMALMLQPIEKVSENDGIKMEVVALINDDEMAVIYVTLQDFTKNRIDETADLYDFTLSGAHILNSQLVNFDQKTKTATFRIQANGGKDFDNKKVNFKITSFLSNKQTHNVAVNANMTELTQIQAKTISLDMNNIPGGSGDLFELFKSQGTIQVLKPNEKVIKLPEVDFMEISNLGIIDERLHIQAHWTGDDIHAHGYFYFKDKLGKKIQPSNIYFGIDDKSGQSIFGREYVEYIFDLNDLDFGRHDLFVYLVSNGNYTKGNWNTTFNMKSVGDVIKLNFSKDFGNWKSKYVSISPLGVTLDGLGTLGDPSNIEISIKMKDGSIEAFNSSTNFIDNDKISVKFVPLLPLDLLKVKSIMVDGTEINL
jgi:hypothetical protein